MPTILNATACPVSPVFSGVYNPTSGPLGSHLFAQGDTTTVRPGLNENAGRSDLNARFGGGGYAIVHGLTLSAGSLLVLNIAAGQAQINGPVTYQGGTANLTNAGRNWIWISQAGAITVAFNSLTPPAGAQALVGSALTAAGSISSVDTSGVLSLVGSFLMRETADTTTPGDTPSARLRFFNKGNGKLWWWDGSQYWDFTGVTLPVSIANGGTGATTAAGARTALGVSREGQIIKTINGNTTLADTDTTYSEIELAQGSVAAHSWTLTFPSAAAMLAAGTVAGHVWVIRNDTNYSCRIINPGTDLSLPEQSQGIFFFDSVEVFDVAQNYPQFAAITATTAGDWSPSFIDQQYKALIDFECSGAARTANFVASTGRNRGRLIAVRNDNDSSQNLTAKVSGGDANYDTVLIPGEIQLTTMLGDGVLSAAPNRPFQRRVATNFASDANKTLTVLEALAYSIEVTDTAPVLTTIRNVVMPLVSSHEWLVRNSCLHPLQFIASSGLGVVVRPGKSARIACNGTDFRWAESYACAASGSEEVIGAQTSSVTVSNSTTETTLVGTLFHTNVLAANLLVPGRVIRVTAWGLLSTDAVAHTLTLKVKFGSTVLASTGAMGTLNTAITNGLWNLEALITCRTRGASGTVFTQGRWIWQPVATYSVPGATAMLNTTTTAVDTTASQTCDLTSQWGAGVTATDSITLTNLVLEVLN